MPLIKHINYLIQASALADAENRRLEEEHGIDTSLGINPFDPKVVKWASEPRHEKEKLENYLNQLGYDTLLKLETLMYFGRDDGDFQETLKHLSDLKESKHDIVRTMVEKRAAYPVYFQNALYALKEQSVDIDSI